MCGRYAATANPDELIEEFEVDEDHHTDPVRSLLSAPQDPPPAGADYNMAPTKLAPVVLTRRPHPSNDGSASPIPSDSPRGSITRRGEVEGKGEETAIRQLRLLTWGLVPSWADTPKVGLRMINARAESLFEKRAFTKAALTRRAIVPARAWYEWQVSPTATDAKGKPRKQPFAVSRADGATLAFGGLYEFWRDRSVPPEDPNAWVTSFSIITTAAEPGLDRIHDRQPLVLERGDWAEWLDPETTDRRAVEALLQPHAPGRFVAHPISTAVNAVRNNGARLLDPVAEADLVGVVDPMTGEVIG
ncbi:SOS response-associated peptidase [Kribbia dieselivorans]|uniref:SOS response-associated peptidase n=1 Tax=Kribbia dieselivorans TaxID=331526 RepID=UPI00083996C7|nr:SOS response-associated peptidase [Kribbia dieselivorans]